MRLRIGRDKRQQIESIERQRGAICLQEPDFGSSCGWAPFSTCSRQSHGPLRGLVLASDTQIVLAAGHLLRACVRVCAVCTLCYSLTPYGGPTRSQSTSQHGPLVAGIQPANRQCCEAGRDGRDGGPRNEDSRAPWTLRWCRVRRGQPLNSLSAALQRRRGLQPCDCSPTNKGFIFAYIAAMCFDRVFISGRCVSPGPAARRGWPTGVPSPRLPPLHRVGGTHAPWDHGHG